MRIQTLKPGCVMMCCVVMSFVSPSLSLAQGDENEWRFGVTPRLWVTATTAPDEDNVSNGTVLMPLYGGTVSLYPGIVPNLGLLITGLYGTGDGDGVFTDTGTDGDLDYKRTDIEALLRYSFPGTGMNVSLGARYVKFISKFEASNFLGTFRNRSESEIWLGEVGLGLVTDITEDGRHRVFGNLIGTFGSESVDFKDNQGFSSSDSDVVVGADVNIGYQWWVTSFANIGLRYRSFVLSQTNDVDLTKFVTVHGPEASIGIVF